MGGSTAEAFLLSEEERLLVMKTVSEHVAGRCTLIAHIGCISTKQSIKLAQAAKELGYDAISAAREGAKVILIERNTCLGGVGTQALVNHILGARKYDDADGLTTCIAGIFSELEEALLKEEAAVDSFKINFANNSHGWYASLGAGMILLSQDYS